MATLNSAAPTFAVSDVDATIRWYKENLGFDADPFPPQEPYVFAILWRDHIEIMLMRIEGYEKPDLYSRRVGGYWDAYIRTKSVAEIYESVRDKVEIIRPLSPQPYGATEFWMKDLNGYILAFSE